MRNLLLFLDAFRNRLGWPGILPRGLASRVRLARLLSRIMHQLRRLHRHSHRPAAHPVKVRQGFVPRLRTEACYLVPGAREMVSSVADEKALDAPQYGAISDAGEDL